MQILKRIIIGLVSLIVILILVSYLLPGSSVVTRSIEIKAPVNVVYAQFSDFNNWNNWSPWFRKDTTMKQTIMGAAGSGGHTLKWESTNKDLGHGSIAFDKVVQDNSIDATLTFDDMKMQSTIMWRLEPSATGTNITWSDSATLGYNPMMRWMGLFMDKFMGPDFESGLKNMKAYAEKNATITPK
ncbi:MAG: SRPBCC family protein [Bacteroidota bacterium]|nr:SRPBCC family protein [Bacteroidota bacterium]